MTKTASPDIVFGAPVAWRAEAAVALGIADADLPAAISPGAGFPTVLCKIVAALPPSARTVVDVGSGAGGASAFLHRATGCAVYAVEPSPTARQTAHRCFPQLRQIDGVAAETGLPGGIADVVVMCGLLSLIDEPHTVLVEAKRLLAPGGVLGVADVYATRGHDLRSLPNVFRTLDTVNALCRAHDLTEIDVVEARPTPDPEWAAIAATVDEWIERECRDRDGFAAWRRDHEHLARHIANGDVVGGCVIAHAPVQSA